MQKREGEGELRPGAEALVLSGHALKRGQFEPLPVKNSDVLLFSLRASELLKSISSSAIRLHRLIELQKIMLKSPQMRPYFQQHPQERKLLLHKLSLLCKKYQKTKLQLPSSVPSYLTPSIAELDQRPQKLQLIHKRHQQLKSLQNKMKRINPVMTDPSQVPSYSSNKEWKRKKLIKKRKHKQSGQKKATPNN